MFLFFLFLYSNVADINRSQCHKQKSSVIFYTNQTKGACTGVYACNRKHEMDKTAGLILK